MARLKYLDSAKQDLVNTLRYISRESGSVSNGQQFVGALRQQCRHLASLPDIWADCGPNFDLTSEALHFVAT